MYERRTQEVMVPIILRVDHVELGRVMERLVETSPLRVGRNSLNEIHLPYPFVSAWHGILRFDEDGIHFYDLDSTNGTLIDEEPVEKSVEVPVGMGSELRIGPVILTFEAVDEHSRETPHEDELAAVLEHGEQATVTGDPVLPAAEPASASGELRHIVQRVLPWARAPRTDAEAEQLLERVAATVQSFCESFIGLRRGHDQFCEETGIQVLRGLGPLYRTENPAEVLSYLLDCTPAGGQRLQELRSVFADASIHQVALWEGMRAGVHALLKALSPDELDIRLGVDKSWSPFKAKARVEAYTELLHEFMTDEQTLASVFLGREFVRAYASVAGQKYDEEASPSLSLMRSPRGQTPVDEEGEAEEVNLSSVLDVKQLDDRDNGSIRPVNPKNKPRGKR
jgi:predicted component of type VI protein secretion system